MKNNYKINPITFSLLCASYNNAKYIQETIESVLSQTYPCWELIIVDDASTDNSVDVIKPYLKDNRIKLIINKKNLGVGPVLNIAFENSSKQILGLLDSDDKLDEKALEIFAKTYQENPKSGFIHSNYWICDSKLRKVKIARLNGMVDPEKTNLLDKKTSHFRTFRRDVYDITRGFNPNFSLCLDGDIIYKLEEVTELIFIDIPLYYYRVHKKGVTTTHKLPLLLEEYKTKVHAYYRRLNTEIPNITIDDLYFEYWKVTFFKMVFFFRLNKEYFRMEKIIGKISSLLINLPNNVYIKLMRIKKKYFYWI